MIKCNIKSCKENVFCKNVCGKHYRSQRYLRMKKVYLDYLGGVCSACGSDEELEFDHIIPGSQSFRIGARMHLNKQTVLNELNKCQLLCRRCHLHKSIKERGHNIAEHGSPGMYNNYKCRCERCREAWRLYCLDRRAKKRLAKLLM